MNSIRLLLLFALILLFETSVESLNVNFDQVELINGTFVEGLYQFQELKVSKIDEHHYSLSAKFDTLTDLDDKYLVSPIFRLILCPV